jgi:hypothetical protein
MNEQMTTKRLPDTWVQKIFATMQAYYGNRFINMWCTKQLLPDGRDAGMVNAMQMWGERLAPYYDKPEVFKKVLDCLPSEPPNLPQFMDMLKNCYVPSNTLQITDTLTEEQKATNRKRIQDLLQNVCKKV